MTYCPVTDVGLLGARNDHPAWQLPMESVPVSFNGAVQQIRPVDGGLKLLLSAACNSLQHHPTRARPEIGESHRQADAPQGML
jgi:hypothetical protein